jgi:hypothetical protein
VLKRVLIGAGILAAVAYVTWQIRWARTFDRQET